MKESYEPLQFNILMLSAVEPICASDHDNGNGDYGELPGPPPMSRHPGDEA